MYNTPEQQPVPHPFTSNPAPSYPAPLPLPAPAPVAQAAVANARLRSIAIGIFVSAGLVLIAAFSKSWFTAGSEGGVGLLGVENCRGSICRSISWGDLPKLPAQIQIFAMMALVTSLVTVAMLVHTGAMLLRGTPEAVKLKWLQQLVGLATMASTAFVFSLMFGDWSRGLSIGWSAFVGLAGIIGAAALVTKAVRPLATAKQG